MTDNVNPFSEYYLYSINNPFLDLRTSLVENLDKPIMPNFLLSELNEQRNAQGLKNNPLIANQTACAFLDLALGLYKPFLMVGMSDLAKALMQDKVSHELLLTLSSMSMAVILGIYGSNENEALEFSGALGGEVFCSAIFLPYYMKKLNKKIDDPSKLTLEITALLGKHSQELIQKQVLFSAQGIFQYAVGSAYKKSKGQEAEVLLSAYKADPRIYGTYLMQFLQNFHALITTYVKECCQTKL